MILYPPANSIAFSIFNYPIRWYGLIMAFSILTGILLSSYLYKRFFGKKNYLLYLDLVPIIVLISIIGARLFYVVGNLEYFKQNIAEILFINHGGISIYGAILFGIITIVIYSKIKKMPILPTLDIISVVMPLCQSIGRWGNFINQEAYGAPYNGFLKMFIYENHRYSQYYDIEYYHPAFLYESLLDLILFFVLIFIFLKFKNIKAGTIFILYLLLYSIIRIIVESVRIDSVCYIFNMPAALFISILVLITAIIYLVMKNKIFK